MGRSKVRNDRYGDKFQSASLADTYKASLTDTELLALRQEIALMDTRLAQLVAMIDGDPIYEDDVLEDIRQRFPYLDSDQQEELSAYVTGYLPQNFVDYRTFGRLQSLVERYESAQLGRKIRDADEALRALFLHIREGRKVATIWQDIQDAMDTRRKLVDTEQRRMVMNEQMIPVDKVIFLMSKIIDAIRGSVTRYVTDREIQDFILAEARSAYERNVFGPVADSEEDQRIVDIERPG